jgi:hypothetical protein
LHYTNEFENDLDCPETFFSNPEGKKSSIDTDVYVSRWVYSIHSLFIAILWV